MQMLLCHVAAGMLLSGPNSKLFESQVMQFVSLLARELCIRNYFLRLFVLDDTLKKVRKQQQQQQQQRCLSAHVQWQVRELVQNYESDPANIPRIRSSLNEASKDIILLVEVTKQQQLLLLHHQLRRQRRPL